MRIFKKQEFLLKVKFSAMALTATAEIPVKLIY